MSNTSYIRMNAGSTGYFFCLLICQKISALDKIFVKSKQYLANIENLPNDESRPRIQCFSQK